MCAAQKYDLPTFITLISDGHVDMNVMDVDSHTAGGLLKLYLRELPVPLIIPRYEIFHMFSTLFVAYVTHRFYTTFLKVYGTLAVPHLHPQITSARIIYSP